MRSHHYQGDPHPSTRKAVVTVTLEDLQRTGALKSDAAVHKFKLLAGVRFSDERQSVKVACERFPEEAQNVRWAAERIELLVKEANVSILMMSSHRAPCVQECGECREERSCYRGLNKALGRCLIAVAQCTCSSRRIVALFVCDSLYLH